MDLTFMRQGYQNEGLTKEQLSTDPFLQFEAWFRKRMKRNQYRMP